ncbi:hypothetical protein PC9H_001074 [Pleurotus ostreatus]|uniref:Proteasome assembly chaperone 3 n=2 Tax=Pleurotus ostreatus TaxID=5322 RepID=A0A8H7A687_PLEOS|nr:uncharacterized protein PC9H_001074 [Pleurotus ostreatus]KAF7440726.1 hypothetical protein PC9H_001074 [Pleurotus ostreatus]KAJ8699879.1 hypothetical protein PTI98_002956 [Pleurotus ostreatus]
MSSTSRSKEIDGQNTDVLLQYYADRILVVVTQFGKVGSLIQASIPSTAPLLVPSDAPDADEDQLPQPPPSIQLTPLMGSAQSDHMHTLNSLYASQIATLVWLAEETLRPSRRNVVVGLALRRTDSETIPALIDVEKRTFVQIMGVVREALASQEDSSA